MDSTTMRVDSLPSEILQTILRYAISVPVFFDTDPEQVSSIEDMITLYQDERLYYAAERTLNALRRVCSSWNDYLVNFSFRYVDFDYVFCGFIPRQVVSKAIRISLLYPKDLEDESFKQLCSSFFDLLEHGEDLWALEIFRGNLDDLTPLRSKAPRLKSIINGYHWPQPNDRLFPNATFMLGFGTPDSMESQLVLPPLRSSYLTTLSIDLHLLYESCSSWKLPSLRNLSFRTNDRNPEGYLKMLRAIGKELRTLYDTAGLREWSSSAALPDEVWTLCPKLERFQTSFTWPPQPSIPSSLQSLRVNLGNMTLSGRFRYENLVPVEALRRVGVRTIVLHDRWINSHTHGPYITFMLRDGFTIRDIHGISFQEFVIMLARRSLRGDRRMDHYIQPALVYLLDF